MFNIITITNMDIRVQSASSTVMHDYINNSMTILSLFPYHSYNNNFVINNLTVQNYTLYFTPTYTNSAFGSTYSGAPQTILQFAKID